MIWHMEIFKVLNKKIAAHKVLRDKAFNIDINLKCDGYQRWLASMVYKLFDKKSSGDAIKKEIMQNEKWAKELNKSIIGKFQKRKIQPPYRQYLGCRSCRYAIDK